MKRGEHNVMINLGAHNAAVSEREENDYYATDPRAVGMLLGVYVEVVENGG